LPASALAALSPSQLELVLIHELAHVRRHDMWVNLLQRVAETLLFFNPAAWYVSHRIATLREFCCDELTCRTVAPERAQAKTEYALALLRVAEVARRSTSRLAVAGSHDQNELVALAATGRTASQLRARIASLLGEPIRDPLRLSTGGMLLVAVIAFGMLVAPVSWRTAARSDDTRFEPRPARLATTAERGTAARELSPHTAVTTVETTAPQGARAAVGRFSGVVRLEGKPPEPEFLPQNPRINKGKSTRDESLRINRIADNGLANVFVYLDQGPNGLLVSAPEKPLFLNSDGVAFSPHASIGRVGQKLVLRNEGRGPDNFHFFLQRNPTINQMVPPGREATLEGRLSLAEKVPIEICSDRHSWMRAFMLVVDHPLASVTDELGAFDFPDLPPAKYSFRVWHERAGFLEKELAVEIKSGATTKMALSYKLDRFER
jgi:BlaR1 peptidase M56